MKPKLVLAAGIVAFLATDVDAATVEVVRQIEGEVLFELVSMPDSKVRVLNNLKIDLEDSSWSVPLFFPEQEDVYTRMIRLVDSDPWMFFKHEIQNNTQSEIFFSLVMRLATDTTSGPTFKDSFLDLDLADTNGDGIARSRDTSARFDVIDDDTGGGGDAVANLATSPGGGFAVFQGEGGHSVFDVSGPGPNSDDVVETEGYKRLDFFLNGRLTPGDTAVFTGFGCYAATLDLCPERSVLDQLGFDDIPGDPDPSAVPLPMSLLFLGTSLLSFAGLRRRARAVSARQ